MRFLQKPTSQKLKDYYNTNYFYPLSPNFDHLFGKIQPNLAHEIFDRT